MSRKLLLAGLLGLALLSASWAGDDRSKAIQTKRVALEHQLRVLLEDHGPEHPDVVALRKRIAGLRADGARGKESWPEGWLVVLSRGSGGATLKDARIRSVGGRSFVVGREVEGPNITRPTFVGKVVWIPLEDVRQMVEWEEPKGK